MIAFDGPGQGVNAECDQHNVAVWRQVSHFAVS
jgi:hypothetical protein